MRNLPTENNKPSLHLDGRRDQCCSSRRENGKTHCPSRLVPPCQLEMWSPGLDQFCSKQKCILGLMKETHARKEEAPPGQGWMILLSRWLLSDAQANLHPRLPATLLHLASFQSCALTSSSVPSTCREMRCC